MRIFIYTVLSLALAAAAFGQDAPKKEAAASEKKPAAEGKLATPFGVAKTTKPVAQPKPKKVQQDWQVEKDGKDFKFTKKTPFGPSSWTRTEAELSADERDVAERGGLLKPVEDPADGDTETEAAAKQLEDSQS
jgi:hypothetical protein